MSLGQGQSLRKSLGPFDGMVCLVSEDKIPFISIPRAFFAQMNALATMGALLITLGIEDA